MSSAQAAVSAAQSKVQSTSAALQSAKAKTQTASQATSAAQATYDQASAAVTAAQKAYDQEVQTSSANAASQAAAESAYQQAVTTASTANAALKSAQTAYAAAKDQLEKDQAAAAATEDVAATFYKTGTDGNETTTKSEMAGFFKPTATVSVDANGKVTVKIFSVTFASMIESMSFENGGAFTKSNLSADQKTADWTGVAPGLANDYKIAVVINTGMPGMSVMHETAYLNLASSDKLTAAVAAGKRLAAEQTQVDQLNNEVQNAQTKANEANTKLQEAAKAAGHAPAPVFMNLMMKAAVDTVGMAKANLQAAQNDFNDAKNALATAKENQTTASQNEAAAQKAFDDAQAALKQAQANLATVKQTVENGPAAVAAAQKAVTDAQAALEAAQANLADAQAELTAANARLAAAQAALQKALGQLAIAKAAAGVVDGATSEPTPNPTAKPTPAPQGTATLTTAKVQLTTAQPAAAQKAGLPQTGNASASALTVLGMALMSLVLVPFKKFVK